VACCCIWAGCGLTIAGVQKIGAEVDQRFAVGVVVQLEAGQTSGMAEAGRDRSQEAELGFELGEEANCLAIVLGCAAE